MLVAEQLQSALNTRIVIERAKGVLANQGQTDMSAALDALRGFARGTDQRLGFVASELRYGRLSPIDVLASSPRRG